MPRFAMNEQTTYRWSFEEDLLHYRDAGYDGVGVWLRKLRDFGEERAVELVAESGLGVSSVSWVGGFTGSDALSAEENLAEARDAIDLCAELRAECLVLYTGGRNGHTRRNVNRLLHAALERLLPHAEASGVRLALEPMHPACAGSWTFLTCLESTLRLVSGYRSAALGIALDTYHFSLGEEDADLARELAPHLAVVHVGDYDEPRGVDQARVPLGGGGAPLGTTLRVLDRAGYRGFYDIKLLGPEVETLDYDGLLRASRRELEALSLPAHDPTTTPEPDACNATW